MQQFVLFLQERSGIRSLPLHLTGQNLAERRSETRSEEAVTSGGWAT